MSGISKKGRCTERVYTPGLTVKSTKESITKGKRRVGESTLGKMGKSTLELGKLGSRMATATSGSIRNVRQKREFGRKDSLSSGSKLRMKAPLMKCLKIILGRTKHLLSAKNDHHHRIASLDWA